MIKGDYDRLVELAKFNECAEHHSPLEVAWYGKDKCYVLRCGEDHYPDTLTRQLSLTQELKAGANIPEPIKSNIEKGIAKRWQQATSTGFSFLHEGVPDKDLATGELLDPEKVSALMDYAYKYNLDPFRGHLVLMYGKPYITIDGYLFHARQSGRAFTLKSRPLTTVEEKQYKVGKTDHAWVSEVQFTDTCTTLSGLGVVTYAEMTAKSKGDETKLRSPVVAAHPWQLAQKRAEWQALRRAFPIGESEEKKEES